MIGSDFDFRPEEAPRFLQVSDGAGMPGSKNAAGSEAGASVEMYY